MSLVEITNVTDVIYFSQMEEKEMEEFIKNYVKAN